MLQAAERLHCSPWEIEPGDTPTVWMWRRFAADTELRAAQDNQQWEAAKQQRMRDTLARAGATA